MTATLRTSMERVATYVSTFKNKPEGCSTVLIAQQLAFFCHRALHDSAGGGTPRGWIILGRWISPKIIQSIKEQTDLKFELVTLPAAEALTSKAFVATPNSMESLIGRGEPVVTRQDERLTLSFPIIGGLNNHIGDIRMEWPRRSVANARQAMEQTRNTLLLLLVGAAVVIIVLIDRLIVRRLRQLKDDMGAIVSDINWNGTINATGNDEITQLANFSSGLMGIVRAQLAELRNLSSIDTLTGLPNRRIFDARLTHVLAQFVRANRPASLILIDVDHFKRYNDTYGHPAGDVALQRVSACLKTTLRRQLDLAVRLGGEEFAVVCDETPMAGAVVCAELVRNAILEAAITHSGNPPLCILSISLGIATIQDGDTTTTLYQRADKALYLAKTSGRNRVSTGE